MIVSQNYSGNVTSDMYFMSCSEASKKLKDKDVSKQEKFELLADVMNIGVRVIGNQKHEIEELKKNDSEKNKKIKGLEEKDTEKEEEIKSLKKKDEEKKVEIEDLKKKDTEKEKKIVDLQESDKLKDEKIAIQKSQIIPILKDAVKSESKNKRCELGFKNVALKSSSIALKIIGYPLEPIIAIGLPFSLLAEMVVDPIAAVVSIEKYAVEKMPEMVKIPALKKEVDKIIDKFRSEYRGDNDFSEYTKHLPYTNDPEASIPEWAQAKWDEIPKNDDRTLDLRIAERKAYAAIDNLDAFYKQAVKEYYDE